MEGLLEREMDEDQLILESDSSWRSDAGYGKQRKKRSKKVNGKKSDLRGNDSLLGGGDSLKGGEDSLKDYNIFLEEEDISD